MVSRFTLVPAECFTEDSARRMLEEVVPLNEGEPLSFLDIPSCKAVLLYAGDARPVAYEMLMSLFKIREYNKILVNWDGEELSMVVAQGDSLVFCNNFRAGDFVTAQYYIFMVLKKLQLNPEISTIYSLSPLDASQYVALCSYFKNAEVLS